MLSTLLVFSTVLEISWASTEDFNAKIIFHPKSEKDVSVSHNLIKADNILKSSSFVRSSPTVFYFHGCYTNLDVDVYTNSIVEAYRKTSFNILLLDWRELTNAAYPNAVRKLEKLGREIVKFIRKMTTKGYEINKWHLVGHSLGAHLAGIVGRHSKSQSLTLPRITALDPAGPGFYILAIGPRPISRSDATFVDVIHTDDAGILGAPFNTGTVDFGPNGGHRSQPGCSIISDIEGCSHSRSIELWIDSVENKVEAIFRSRSSVGRIAHIGLNCSTISLPGSYNLKTNKSSPYSSG